jgi:hypothetical protein
MRKLILAALVGSLLWFSVGHEVVAGDNLPDGNGALPITMIGGDNLPDGNG